MSEVMPKTLKGSEIPEFLGIGLTKYRELCRKRPHGFPVSKLGAVYVADAAMLNHWRTEWLSGKFEI